MAFLRHVTSKAEAVLLRWPWRPRAFNSKVMAFFSLAFAVWGILQIANTDYGLAIISFVNTLLFGLWARALWRREHA